MEYMRVPVVLKCGDVVQAKVYSLKKYHMGSLLRSSIQGKEISSLGCLNFLPLVALVLGGRSGFPFGQERR